MSQNLQQPRDRQDPGLPARGAPSATRVVVAFVATFVIMFLVPLLPYGTLSAVAGLEPPSPESPGRFMASVVVMKLGIALGFVGVFLLGRRALAGRWPAYAAVWWLMYAIVELGQGIDPGYSWLEAGAGVVAEAIYFPLSAWLVDSTMRPASPASRRSG